MEQRRSENPDRGTVDRQFNNSDLHVAVRSGDEAALGLIRGGSFDPNIKNDLSHTPLMYAAFYHRPHAAQALLAAGAEVNMAGTDGLTALHAAAASDSIAVAQQLIDHGANLEAVSERGETPLHVAAFHNAGSVARALLEAGADASKSNLDGKTPRELAKGPLAHILDEGKGRVAGR